MTTKIEAAPQASDLQTLLASADGPRLLQAANAFGYKAEGDGAELFHGRHLQPGVVNYPEMKNPATGAQGIALLVEKAVIDAMRESAVGQPVVNWAHDMSGGSEKWLKDGRAVGVMVASRWDGDDVYEHCSFMLWDVDAKANARNGYRLSNAWKEDEIDWTPGIHNGVKYDGRLKAAHYTHLAIVPNPRYEGAVIFANSIGDTLMKIFGFGGKPEGVTLAKDAKVKVGEKEYSPLEVANAVAAMEAAKAKVIVPEAAAIAPEHSIEIEGKKYTGLEVANALKALEQAKADEETKKKAAPAPAATGKFEETPEFQNAVDARVKEALDKAVGEGFFNGIEQLARLRPPQGPETKPAGRMTERERVEIGRKRFGKKEPVKA